MTEKDWGVLLACRKRSPFWHLPLAFTVIGLSMGVAFYAACSIEEPYLGLGLAGVISLFLIGYAFFWYFDEGYGFYEGGLMVHRAFSSQPIGFDEIESYQYYRICIETLFERESEYRYHYTILYRPDGGRERTQRLVFKELDYGVSLFLRLLKGTISRRLKLQRLKEGVVPWTQDVYLTLSGIEKKYTGRHSEGLVSVLSFEEIQRCEFRKVGRSWIGYLAVGCWRSLEIITVPMRTSTLSVGIRNRERFQLEICGESESRPIITLRCDSMNFYPVYTLFQEHGVVLFTAVHPDGAP